VYKKTIDLMTNTTSTNQIRRKSDGAIITFDPANTDYQEYLAWLAEGNTPEEAE